MNTLGRLALFSLLVGISSHLSAGTISGVIRFTGAIVEPPCSMNASQQDESRRGFRLSGCPMHARTAEVSIRSMRTGEVRKLQPNDLSLGTRDFSARYDLAKNFRRPDSYLVTVSYP